MERVAQQQMESEEVRVTTFSEVLGGQEVHFYILRMKQSFLLWAGTDGSFATLSVAMNTRFVSLFFQLTPNCSICFSHSRKEIR